MEQTSTSFGTHICLILKLKEMVSTAYNTEFVAQVLTHFRSNALRALHKLWKRYSKTRLKQSYWGLPEDKDLFLRRTLKEAVHEIGHL